LIEFFLAMEKNPAALFWVGVIRKRSPMENGSPAMMVLATA